MNSLNFFINSKNRFVFASTAVNIAVGIVKLIAAVTIYSELFAISGLYSLALCMVKIPYLHYDLKSHRWEKAVREQSSRKTLFAMNVSIIVLGFLFLVFGLRMFFTRKEVHYNTYSVYVLALCSFIKLITSIYWIVKLKGNNGSIDYTLKLTNFADALVSIALTQSALLVMKGIARSAYYDSLFGLLVGLVVIVIGFISLSHSSKKALSW